MSSPSATIEPGLDLLRHLYPPHSLIHVGIGHGTGPMHSWRDWAEPAEVVLIDADASRTHWAQALTAEHAGWRLIDETLLDQADGPTHYYRASNPDEDGLLDPQQLTALWPNLRQRDQGERPAKRLDSLLGELELGASLQAPNAIWLLIDCLPAGRILRGASELLEQATLIWARVLLRPLEGVAEDALLSTLETQLKPLRYRRVQVNKSNHPALGQALFVRDWPKVLRAQAHQQAQARIEQLTNSREAAKAEAEKQAQRAAACQQLLEQRTNSREAAKAEAEAAKAEAAAQTEAKVEAELQAQARVAELTQALAAANAENRELRQRQDLTEDEILKAQTQIDFIRELLLKDSAP